MLVESFRSHRLFGLKVHHSSRKKFPVRSEVVVFQNLPKEKVIVPSNRRISLTFHRIDKRDTIERIHLTRKIEAKNLALVLIQRLRSLDYGR